MNSLFDMISLFVQPAVAAMPLLYLFITYLIYSKEDKKIVHSQAYPPTRESAIWIQKIAGKKVNERGIVAAIIELCREGCLKINKEGGNYDVLKISDYEGRDTYKQKIMSAMFDGNEELSSAAESIIAYPVYHLTRDGKLKEKVREIIKQINDEHKTAKGNGGYYRRDSKKWKIASIVLLEILMMNYMHGSNELVTSLVMIPFLAVGTRFIDEISFNKINNKSIMILFFALVWFCIIFDVMFSLVDGLDGKASMVFATIMIIISYIINVLRKKPASFANEKHVLNGFLKMIKDKHEVQNNLGYSKANPNRFYEVLPYVCALGEEKRWINQHKDLEIERPDWIISDEEDSQNLMQECIDTLVNSVK